MRGWLFTAAGRALLAAAAAALVASPTVTSAQPNAVGVNAAVRNQVQIRRANQLRPAVVRERVVLNDEVRTGQASQLQILLLDRSTFTVGANARVGIDRFVYDPSRNTRSTGVSVTRGAFRFMSGRALGRASGPVAVRTPVASIGIRGTIFEGVVGADAVRIALAEGIVGPNVRSDPGTASLVILRGPGPRTQGDTIPGAIDVQAGGRTITLDRPGLAVYVPGPGLAPIGPFPISHKGLLSFQDLLRTTPLLAASAGAGGGGAGGQGTSGGGGGDPSGGTPQGPRHGGDGPGSSGGRGWVVPLGSLAAALLAILVATQGNDDQGVPTSP